MKNLIGFLVPFAALAIVAAYTLPTDTECVHAAVVHNTGTAGDIVNFFSAGDAVYRVENHIIYKSVVSRINGRTVAYGALTTVFYN